MVESQAQVRPRRSLRRIRYRRLLKKLQGRRPRVIGNRRGRLPFRYNTSWIRYAKQVQKKAAYKIQPLQGCKSFVCYRAFTNIFLGSYELFIQGHDPNNLEITRSSHVNIIDMVHFQRVHLYKVAFMNYNLFQSRLLCRRLVRFDNIISMTIAGEAFLKRLLSRVTLPFLNYLIIRVEDSASMIHLCKWRIYQYLTLKIQLQQEQCLQHFTKSELFKKMVHGTISLANQGYQIYKLFEPEALYLCQNVIKVSGVKLHGREYLVKVPCLKHFECHTVFQAYDYSRK